MSTSSTSEHNVAPGRLPDQPGYAIGILIVGLSLIVIATLWLIITGHTNIRYSADHTDTVPLWTRWIPALMGVVIIYLSPPSNHNLPVPDGDARTLGRQTILLLLLALLFPVGLALFGRTNFGYGFVKIIMLISIPLIMMSHDQSITTLVRQQHRLQRSQLGYWVWFGPMLPLSVWFFLTYATPLALPLPEYVWPDMWTLPLTLLIGFLINAVIETLFYRVWLQSRLELLFGRWPAVVLASLVWALWHVVIQGGRGVDIDVATVIANHGVLGLFLGYLWSRYRQLWAVLLVHGALNSFSILLAFF